MPHRCLLTTIFLAQLFAWPLPSPSRAVEPSNPIPTKGEIRYEPPTGEEGVAERFRLPAHSFRFEQTPVNLELQTLRVARVTFPSPVKTPWENNNTVHCEYFQPREGKKYPGVIVLHILGGDFPLARCCAANLAQRGVAALFVKMPYYGPRRSPPGGRKMISPDPQETVEGMTQAILDIRRATAWLSAQKEIDPERLGIFGISLGGITAALATTAEPRIHQACLLLAGGDMSRAGWDSPEVAAARKRWEAMGGTREQFAEALKPIDPITYAASARHRRILMINAKNDHVVPKECTLALWEALGKQELVWCEGTHYSAGWHLPDALHRAERFFLHATPPVKTSPANEPSP